MLDTIETKTLPAHGAKFSEAVTAFKYSYRGTWIARNTHEFSDVNLNKLIEAFSANKEVISNNRAGASSFIGMRDYIFAIHIFTYIKGLKHQSATESNEKASALVHLLFQKLETEKNESKKVMLVACIEEFFDKLTEKKFEIDGVTYGLEIVPAILAGSSREPVKIPAMEAMVMPKVEKEISPGEAIEAFIKIAAEFSRIRNGAEMEKIIAEYDEAITPHIAALLKCEINHKTNSLNILLAIIKKADPSLKELFARLKDHPDFGAKAVIKDVIHDDVAITNAGAGKEAHTEDKRTSIYDTDASFNLIKAVGNCSPSTKLILHHNYPHDVIQKTFDRVIKLSIDNSLIVELLTNILLHDEDKKAAVTLANSLRECRNNYFKKVSFVITNITLTDNSDENLENILKFMVVNAKDRCVFNKYELSVAKAVKELHPEVSKLYKVASDITSNVYLKAQLHSICYGSAAVS